MDNFVFVPLRSIGDITFGENRENVRNKLGVFREFKKTKFAKNTTDDFGFCHVYYNSEDECEAVEFIASKSVVIWNGNNISSFDYAALAKLVGEYDNGIEIDTSGFTSKKFQMSVYAPNKKDVEGILVAQEGYYE